MFWYDESPDGRFDAVDRAAFAVTAAFLPAEIAHMPGTALLLAATGFGVAWRAALRRNRADGGTPAPPEGENPLQRFVGAMGLRGRPRALVHFGILCAVATMTGPLVALLSGEWSWALFAVPGVVTWFWFCSTVPVEDEDLEAYDPVDVQVRRTLDRALARLGHVGTSEMASSE